MAYGRARSGYSRGKAASRSRGSVGRYGRSARSGVGRTIRRAKSPVRAKPQTIKIVVETVQAGATERGPLQVERPAPKRADFPKA